jgi:hypothetical protein
LEDCQHIKGQGRCFLITEEAIEIGSVFYNFPDVVAEHIEFGCLNKRHISLPKIKDFDEATHTFTFDEQYYERSFAEGRYILGHLD